MHRPKRNYNKILFSINKTFFQHSESETIRTLVRKHDGLAPLVQLIKQENTLKDKELLIAATGAVWKLSYSVENVEIFDKLDTIPRLVFLLSYDDETVSVNTKINL